MHKPLIIGHRGAHGLAPDNTLEGFEIAIQNGVDQIETDVRITSDGRVVLTHDEHLTSADKRLLRIIDSTYPQLLAHHAALVTLDEAISFIGRRTRLMVEVKREVQTAPVVAILRRFLTEGWTPDDFIFASFDFEVLKELSREMPDIELVVLESWSSWRARRRADALGTPYLSMDQRYLWWGFVYLISRRYKLFCYPYRKIYHIKHRKPAKWFKYGLYGVITDRPDLFR
jgi:glycerophosphoryl diester phosphodiesterase